MGTPQRKRIAERFARQWKRQIRAEDGERHRRTNILQRQVDTARPLMIAMTLTAAIAALALWLLG